MAPVLRETACVSDASPRTSFGSTSARRTSSLRETSSQRTSAPSTSVHRTSSVRPTSSRWTSAVLSSTSSWWPSVTPFRWSGRHALQASSFALAHAAPHAVALVPTEGVVQALDTDRAVRADPLGLPGGATLLREEHLWIVLPAPGPLLPGDVVMHRPPSPESHGCDSEGIGAFLASGCYPISLSAWSPHEIVH